MLFESFLEGLADFSNVGVITLRVLTVQSSHYTGLNGFLQLVVGMD